MDPYGILTDCEVELLLAIRDSAPGVAVRSFRTFGAPLHSLWRYEPPGTRLRDATGRHPLPGEAARRASALPGNSRGPLNAPIPVSRPADLLPPSRPTIPLRRRRGASPLTLLQLPPSLKLQLLQSLLQLPQSTELSGWT